jgi:hypothetical protein
MNSTEQDPHKFVWFLFLSMLAHVVTTVIRRLLCISACAASIPVCIVFYFYHPPVIFLSAHPPPKSPFLSLPAAQTHPPERTATNTNRFARCAVNPLDYSRAKWLPPDASACVSGDLLNEMSVRAFLAIYRKSYLVRDLENFDFFHAEIRCALEEVLLLLSGDTVDCDVKAGSVIVYVNLVAVIGNTMQDSPNTGLYTE